MVRTTTLMILAAMASAVAVADDSPVQLRTEGDTIILEHASGKLAVSLLSPRLAFEGLAVVGGAAPSSVTGGPEAWEAHYAPVTLAPGETAEVVVFARWSAEEGVLRKWADVRLTGNAEPRLLAEVVLDEWPAADLREAPVVSPPQSFPAYLRGFFAGVEYPVASTRVEGDRVVLAHRPGARMEAGKNYTTRAAVYGCGAEGREKESFHRYIRRHRPGRPGLHVNYNSWWTSSVPFSEQEILGLMQAFEDNLYKPHGATPDTFTIDMGWSDRHSLWGINPAMFPEGFGPIRQAAERMGSRLGLWISPSSCYVDALDPEWAAAQGYETFTVPAAHGPVRLCCLGGERYATAFRERLVDMLTRYGIRHVKLDGYALTCPESGHGHAPDALSADAVAEGGIRAFAAMREAAPDVWLEATCFGWNPSPWWLFHVNSVIGTFGDDAPHGRVPAPVYRESYTTARDFFNLQGAAWLQAPVAAQEVLGVIHQTPDSFLNDAVVTFLRGQEFVPLYVNPKFMDARRWEALAGMIRWARENPLIYEQTEPVLPASWRDGKAPQFTNDAPMPREPYGYAHWGRERGVVVLRNPWIAPATVPVRVGCETEVSAASLYPEGRVYGRGLAPGATLDVPLAPYETVVLDFRAQDVEGLPEAADRVGKRVRGSEARRRLRRVRFEGTDERFGRDWTATTEPGAEAAALEWGGRVTVADGSARLVVLLEGPQTPAEPTRATCRINGADAALRVASSDAGWSATGIPVRPERWLLLEADLPAGEAEVSLDLLVDCPRISVWAYATRPGDDRAGQPGDLPAPEVISLDAAALLEPAEAPEGAEESIPAIVERIDGVFLDVLEPASASQGWGTLQKNRSVTETPMGIGNRRFARGLGTHAPSRIVYDLDGTYGRFAAWAGGQHDYHATVAFEVWVDGRKAWESGPMTSADAAKAVEVDIRGAKRLELVVTDGGNGVGADHANWADARLLR